MDMDEQRCLCYGVYFSTVCVINYALLCILQETQLQHEVTMKNDLLQKFLRDQELDEYHQWSHRSDEDSRRYL